MKSIKILVILPFYGGSLPIGKYCVKALRQLGHSVRVFDAPQLYPGYQGLQKIDLSQPRLARLTASFVKFAGQAIWEQIQEFEPDIMLAMAQAPVDKMLLQRLKQTHTRSVMWFVEDYALMTYWQYLAPLYDAFAVIQKEPFLSMLAQAGQNHAFYLPLAALPEFHKPIKLSQAEKEEFGSDISFLGAGYPNRRLAFRQIRDRDFKIWGSDWEGEKALLPNLQRNGERISEEDSVKIYNAARINLNLHSNVHTDSLVSGGDFVNPRTFELAAMGAFQLVDRRSLMDGLFAEDELACFGDIEEMKAMLDYFLAHPEEREAYAKRARTRVLKDHTYEKRMETLLGYMEKNFGPWPEQKNQNLQMADISPELAKRLGELAGKLGLGVNASFSDITARLRQRSGPLNELETALLFLDEWKKQYDRK